MKILIAGSGPSAYAALLKLTTIPNIEITVLDNSSRFNDNFNDCIFEKILIQEIEFLEISTFMIKVILKVMSWVLILQKFLVDTQMCGEVLHFLHQKLKNQFMTS